MRSQAEAIESAAKVIRELVAEVEHLQGEWMVLAAENDVAWDVLIDRLSDDQIAVEFDRRGIEVQLAMQRLKVARAKKAETGK